MSDEVKSTRHHRRREYPLVVPQQMEVNAWFMILARNQGEELERRRLP